MSCMPFGVGCKVRDVIGSNDLPHSLNRRSICHKAI